MPSPGTLDAKPPLGPAAPGEIPSAQIEEVARELMFRAAIDIPEDFKQGVKDLAGKEDNPLSRFALDEICANYEVATLDRRPMCADTGMPRWYVKMGNECRVQGAFIELERSLRKATAGATRDIPLRPNRVHPITRSHFDNNLGIHAPEVDYTFEPEADWIDITTVHKGGMFGTDFRMLYPSDGIPGLKRFFLDTMVAFGRRGMSCQPAVVGMGIGGCKDTTMRIAKEAACLRTVGERNPDPVVAELEQDLKQMGNSIGIGTMGFEGNSYLVDTFVEIAYTHTAGMQAAIHTFCMASRRATARIFPDGKVAYRTDPQWFTDYYRREGI